MQKLYLRATGTHTFEWVSELEKATVEPQKEAAEVTLKEFHSAKLERAPQKTQQHDPGWVISKDAASAAKWNAQLLESVCSKNPDANVNDAMQSEKESK